MSALEGAIRILLFNRYLDHPLPWRIPVSHMILDANGVFVMKIQNEEQGRIIINEMENLVQELKEEADLSGFDPPVSA